MFPAEPVQHRGLPCAESWKQIRRGDWNPEIIYVELYMLPTVFSQDCELLAIFRSYSW